MSLPILEYNIQHAVRCLAKAATESQIDYWKAILADNFSSYEAAGGTACSLDRSARTWRIKAPETWFTAEDVERVKPTTTASAQVIEKKQRQAALEQEIRDAEREVHEAGMAYAELRSRLRDG